MSPGQVEGLKGIATLLATVFPGAGSAILLGRSLLDLLKSEGLSGEDYAALTEALRERIRESAEDRRQRVADLGKMVDRFSFVDD